ncbi:hypothetical protein C8Q75DRAFT_893704 [Abortiporus biennis]|nr:hypothetical protein C8Q75DRAFT_893704 [Abortiporus biennis]
MTTISCLPSETFQEILDYLAEDKKSLGSCSQVCKPWVRPIQRTLFSKITILQRARFEEFLTSVETSSHVLRYIVSLSIRGGEGTKMIMVRPDELVQVLEKMVLLRKLELEKVDMDSRNPSTGRFTKPPPITSTFPSMRHLVMKKIHFPLFTNLDIVGMFPGLIELSLLNLGYPMGPFQLINPEDSRPLRLQTLCLDSDQVVNDTLEYIAQTPSSQSLRSLSVTIWTTKNAQALGAALDVFGSTLSSLHLNVEQVTMCKDDSEGRAVVFLHRLTSQLTIYRSTELVKNLGLRKCTNLSSISISFPAVSFCLPRHGLMCRWQGLPYFLKVLPPTLRSITFGFIFRSFSVVTSFASLANRLQSVDWTQAISALKSLPHLETITFHVRLPYSLVPKQLPPSRKLEKVLRDGFHEYDELGMLVFS